MPRLQSLKTRVWVAPFLLAVLVVCGGQAPVPEPATDQETELGQEMYNELKGQGGDRRVLSALRDPETDSGLDFSGGSVALPPSLQILSRPREPAERLRHARRQCLCRGFFALFREEHRAIGGNPLP